MENPKAQSNGIGPEHRRVRSKTIFFLLLMALLGPMSTVLFRVGMEHMRGISAFTPAALLHYGERMVANGYLVLGTFSRSLATLMSFLVFSWADYSFISPVSAVSYVIVAVLGYAVLGEPVSPERWVGIGVICVGAALVGITPVSTTTQKGVSRALQISKSASTGLGHERRKLF